MSLLAVIANALFDNAAVLDLPRKRVYADICHAYGCRERTAREAYALARVITHRRRRRVA